MMSLHQDEQKLIQENVNFSHYSFPTANYENWKQLFFLSKKLKENSEKCSFWPEKHGLANI